MFDYRLDVSICEDTRSVGRWYLPFVNAYDLSDRVWMGSWRQHVCVTPSRRR